MYTRKQLTDNFSCEEPTDLTEDHIDLLEQIQAAGKRHGENGWYPDGNFSSDADWCYGVGRTIRDLEETLNIDDGSIHDLYSEAHSEAFSDGTINPEDRHDYPQIWDFQFGAYGETKCNVHARSIEKALELAADWLEENAPGHLILHGSDEARDMWNEATRDLGYDTISQSEWTDRMTEEVDENATVGLTYTEAGYIRSWEWYVNERE